MSSQKKCSFLLAFALMLMFSGCGVTAGVKTATAAVTDALPSSSEAFAAADAGEEQYDACFDSLSEPENDATDEPGMKLVRVSSVDEFLFALGGNTEIVFDPGEYDLTTASDYGGNTFSECYLWQEVFDGYQLVIHDVTNLIIRSDGAGSTSIVTTPRYANIFSFDACSGVSVEGLTIGHSIEPGACIGGVLAFNCTDTADISCCSLYGCGVTGIWATDSCYITAKDTEIYNCSESAVNVSSCFGFVLDGCSIHDCPGEDKEETCLNLFDVAYGSDFVIANCEIFGNEANCFLNSNLGSQVFVLGSRIEDNLFSGSIFRCTGMAPVVDGCRIGENQLASGGSVYAADDYARSLHAVDTRGNELDEDDLYAMNRESISYSAAYEKPAEDYSEPREVYAETIDELLAAIAPNTTIYLSDGEYLLSDATDYGKGGGSFYYWESCFDGWSLVIHDADNLSIRASGPLSSFILSDCTYAEVLSLIRCSNVDIFGFTFGHSIEGFGCEGGVVNLIGCDGITLDHCRLFGCGIMGITAKSCDYVKANYCEIYDCSNGAITLINTGMLEAAECCIHDCGTPTIYVSENSRISINGNEYDAGYYTMQHGEDPDYSTMWD